MCVCALCAICVCVCVCLHSLLIMRSVSIYVYLKAAKYIRDTMIKFYLELICKKKKKKNLYILKNMTVLGWAGL